MTPIKMSARSRLMGSTNSNGTESRWHEVYDKRERPKEDSRISRSIRGRTRDSEGAAGSYSSASRWVGDQTHCGFYIGYVDCDCPCHGTEVSMHHSCAEFIASLEGHQCKTRVSIGGLKDWF